MNGNRTDTGQPLRFLTVAQAAKLLGNISGPTLYRAIRDGRFPAIKIRGRYVVPAKAIDVMEADALAFGLVDAAEWATGTRVESAALGGA